MLSFFPTGEVFKKRHICSCCQCRLGLFDNCGSSAEGDDRLAVDYQSPEASIMDKEDQCLPYATIF